MLETSGLFRLLGDDVRLRILRLLASERLNVSELTTVLGIAQSGVSRHLGLLREADLVREYRDGGFSFYAAQDQPGGTFDKVWPLIHAELSAEGRGDQARTGAAVFHDDDARLREVKRQRREHRDTHGAIGARGGRQLVPGRSWAAWSRALGLLLMDRSVADLGCGDGHLTLEVAAWARQVIGIDHSPDVLRHARELARRRQATNVTWKRGSLEHVPLDAGAVDLAILSQALHHADDPELALAEAVRIVTDRGRVLVLELEQHEHRWVTRQLGDRWRGFSRATLRQMMESTGLRDVQVRSGLEEEPFNVIVAVGTVRVPRGPRGRKNGKQSRKTR